MIRPDIAFDALELTISVRNATIDVFKKKIEKIIAKAKQNSYYILNSDLGGIGKWSLAVISDASQANLPDGFSSAFGLLILIVGHNRKSCPLA